MIFENEDVDKEKKSFAFKVEEGKESEIDEDMNMLVQKFKQFIKHDNQKYFQPKNDRRSSFVPTFIM